MPARKRRGLWIVEIKGKGDFVDLVPEWSPVSTVHPTRRLARKAAKGWNEHNVYAARAVRYTPEDS